MKKNGRLKNSKYYLIMLGFILTISILLPQKAYAALQSNPSTHYGSRKSPTEWMSQIRSMEAKNNAMGLNEQFNSNLTTKTGTSSNNIDVHMMRSTEYGAIAILAVSGYGNPNTMAASTPEKSTTGNKTGVYYTTTGNSDTDHTELVAGGLSGTAFSGTDGRYYDAYPSTKGSVKVGDAMDLKWQGTSSADWVTSSSPYFYRNARGYFGFYGGTIGSIFGRGVAVCGVGL